MTAAQYLDQLDQLRAVIGDSPVFHVVGFEQDNEEVLARFTDGGRGGFADCYGADAAALVVGAVNALPQLTAALRAVLDLADDMGSIASPIAVRVISDRLKAAITAALDPADT